MVVAACAVANLALAQAPFEWRVPVHESTARDGVLWAGGDDFKVRFERDRVVYFPRMGDRPNQPFELRFAGARIGGAEIATRVARLASTDWRVEFDRGAVREAYEVRDDGVEQTFVFAERPRGAGELVVTMRIETPLAAGAHDGVGAIEFVQEDGAPALRYGAALAFDARGERVDVVTRYRDGQLELAVPSAFVARATFPLTIDPLLSTTTVYSAPIDAIDSVATASDLSVSGASKVASIVSRRFSRADHDVYGFVSPVNYAQVSPIYLDFAADFDSKEVTVCFVGGGTPQFVIAHERLNTATGDTALQVYAHDRISLVVNTGDFGFLALAPGDSAFRPQLGGSRTGTRAMLVFDHHTGVGNLHAIQGARLNLSPLVVQPSFIINNAATLDDRRPAINALNAGATTWRVVWLQVGASNSLLRGAQISYFGSVTSTQTIASFNVPDSESPQYPRIAGEDGRYLVTVVERAGGTHVLRGRRLDWADGTSHSIKFSSTIATHGTDPIHNDAVAFDFTTQSHWASSYWFETANGSTARVRRLGLSGAVVESVDLNANPADDGGPTHVTMSIGRPIADSVFQVLVARQSAGVPVTGSQFTYSPDALVTTVATSCGGTAVASGDRPYAGDEFYSRQIANLPANAVAAFALGFANTNVALDAIGMPGCIYGISSPIYTYPRPADASGVARMVFPLLDAPLLINDELYSQWLWIDVGANALGVRTHAVLEHRVR